MTEQSFDNARKLWQEQPLEGKVMSLEEVRTRIEKLGRRVRRRNLIGGFACITVLLSFVYFAVVIPQLTERIGAALTAIGAAYIGIQLLRGKMKLRRGEVAAASGEPSVEFYRSELRRQRDFHQGAWLWSRIIVFAPGPFVFFLGMAHANPRLRGLVILEALVAGFLLIWSVPRNLKIARAYQRELDALDAGSS